MLKTKCCKHAGGIKPTTWQSPKYSQRIGVTFCWPHYERFMELVSVYEKESHNVEAAADRALEKVKPDQSRVAKRAGVTG